jgi:hypothetical protein
MGFRAPEKPRTYDFPYSCTPINTDNDVRKQDRKIIRRLMGYMRLVFMVTLSPPPHERHITI